MTDINLNFTFGGGHSMNIGFNSPNSDLNLGLLADGEIIAIEDEGLIALRTEGDNKTRLIR
jgi:hypothetical protein